MKVRAEHSRNEKISNIHSKRVKRREKIVTGVCGGTQTDVNIHCQQQSAVSLWGPHNIRTPAQQNTTMIHMINKKQTVQIIKIAIASVGTWLRSASEVSIFFCVLSHVLSCVEHNVFSLCTL